MEEGKQRLRVITNITLLGEEQQQFEEKYARVIEVLYSGKNVNIFAREEDEQREIIITSRSHFDYLYEFIADGSFSPF